MRQNDTRKNRYPDMGMRPAEKVSEKQIRRTSAEFVDKSGQMPELDLHGRTAVQALEEMEQYILAQKDAGAESCRIIHGRGEGVLARVVADKIKKMTGQGIIEDSFPSIKSRSASIVIVFSKETD